jgi:hypothetical protein
MAINLNPGADETLVTAATRAALHNTPADYRLNFENVAKSYDKTMEASSAMWGNITNVVGLVGAEMVENAIELSNVAALAAGLDPENSQFLVDEVYASKDAQKELGFLDFSRETRKKRAELKLEQKQLFADIDLTAESINAGAKAVANGLYDENLSPSQSEMTNAIIKSNLKNKVTKLGNVAKLSRDEVSGELMYTMYAEDGGFSDDFGNDKPITMTIKEFNKNIVDNAKDTKNVIGTSLGALENSLVNLGMKSNNGIMDDQTRQMTLNKLDGMLQTDSDIKRAMHAKFGNLGTSFFEDIKTPSPLSAGLYNTLLTTTGKTVDGEILPQGVVEGIKDLDGSGGISKSELEDADNYLVLSSNIVGLKDPKASKAFFKEYTTDRMAEAHSYGYGKRTIPTGNGNKTDGKLDFYSKGQKIERLGNKGYMAGGTATGIYNKIEAGIGFDAQDPITGETNNYSYQNIGDDTGWYENYQEGDDKSSVQYIGPNGGDVGKKFTNDPRWQSIDTTVEEEVDEFGNIVKADTSIKTLTPQQTLQRVFSKKEEIGKEDLAKLLPANYSFEEKGIGPIDAVEIFDDNMDSLGVYGFDFSNPKKAMKRAEFFLEKFGPNGLDVLRFEKKYD